MGRLIWIVLPIVVLEDQRAIGCSKFQSWIGQHIAETGAGQHGVATATVGLAAAVISKDPGAIAKNAKAVFDAATA